MCFENVFNFYRFKLSVRTCRTVLLTLKRKLNKNLAINSKKRLFS